MFYNLRLSIIQVGFTDAFYLQILPYYEFSERGRIIEQCTEENNIPRRFLGRFLFLRDPFVDPCFLLYINDLPNISKLFSFHLFGDDTNIYCSRKDLNYLELILNQELHTVAEWMKSNRLALSILKTNFVLFHSNKLK